MVLRTTKGEFWSDTKGSHDWCEHAGTPAFLGVVPRGRRRGHVQEKKTGRYRFRSIGVLIIEYFSKRRAKKERLVCLGTAGASGKKAPRKKKRHQKHGEDSFPEKPVWINEGPR